MGYGWKRVLWGVLGVFCGCGPGLHPIVPPTAAPRYFLYVGLQTASGINAFEWSPNSGALTSISDTPTTLAGPSNGLAINSTSQFLYVSLPAANAIYGFSIAKSGVLTALSGFPVATGTTPKGLTVLNLSGRDYLYAVNSGSGSVSAYQIDSTTGALTSLGTAGGTTGPKTIVGFGRYLYLDNSTGLADVFAVNTSTGVPASSSNGAIGSGPSSVSITPSGSFLYSTNALSGDVSIKSVDSNTGAVSGSSSFLVNANPQFGIIDPGGRYFYVAHPTSGDVLGYQLNRTTGATTAVNSVIIANARYMAIDPLGRYLYVGNSSGTSVHGFSIDFGTGSLAALTPASVTTGSGPGMMRFATVSQ